jgi:protocatechuate 3,4-dioxygenase beta subunit
MGSRELPAGTARIAGTVVIFGTGVPARRARVGLSSADLGGSRSATTDDQGRFVFEGLPAGRFTVSASKPGHVSVTFGQRQPGSGRPGTPIQLAEGQKVNVQLQLPRGGVVSGTVLDEHGEAVPGTQVRLFRYTTQGGVRSLVSAGSDATDDRGMYRAYGLQPGDYVVCATPRAQGIPNGPIPLERMQEVITALGPRGDALAQQASAALTARMAAARGDGDPDEPSSGYAPVFYPGTTVAGSAGVVPVGAGEERLGVDFQLQLVPVASIEGIVVASTGTVPNVQLTLVNTGDEISGIGNSSARVDRDGRFRLTNVPPGQYTLMARTARRGPSMPVGPGRGAGPVAPGRGNDPSTTESTRLWASADLTVDGRNLSNIALTLQPGFSLTGRFEFRATSRQAPTDLTRARVALTPSDTTAALRDLTSTAVGRIDESGRFTIDGIVPGKYRVSASVNAAGWTLESALVAGQDALDFPIDVKSAQNLSAVVTFTDRQSDVSGTVTNQDGKPVSDYSLVIYPTDEKLWAPQSRRIRSVRPATDGSFAVSNLPPGEYRLAPVLDPEPGAWFDPTYLQQLNASGLHFTLMEGEKKVQNVRVAGG